MPKYNFDNSLYAKFFESREARELFSKFINDPEIIAQRQYFWKQNFDVDPLLSARDNDGTALFRTAVRRHSVDNMLDMRAPLAETQPRDKKGLEFYTGPIPDFAAKSYVETAMERESRVRMFDSFGNDAAILAAYADDIQEMVDEANFTLSNLGAQLISKGNIVYNFGTGIKGALYSCPIPEENFVKAGEKVWSDPTCNLLDQMEKIETDFRERTGYDGAFKWQVTREVFNNVILKNNTIKEYVTSYRTVNDMPVVAGWAINEKMFNEAIAGNPKISPIEVISEAQRDGEKGVVHGWAQNVAVLRPVGAAGLIKRADILDKEMAQKYGSSVISTVWSQRDIFSLVNTTCNNGKYKEWHTDLFVSAIPTLTEYFEHVIVKIDEANA